MACELLQKEFTNSKGESLLVGVRQLSASRALELHAELVGKFGSSVFPFIDGTYQFGNIIALMQQIDHKEFSTLFKSVISSQTTLEGQEIKPALFDMQFDGELMLAAHVFGFVLEANFLSFFKQGLELNAQRKLEAVEASKLDEQSKQSPQ